ncbi:uncharacterized protein [Asterias amurensis]
MNRPVMFLISALVLGYVFKTNANAKEFLISNESFMKLEEGEMDQYLVERATATMSDSQIAAFLDRHNKLRGETVPAASNMNYLVWDPQLAAMAQEWSEGCKYAHGNPTNISPWTSIGQNLYIEAPGSPSNPVLGSGPVQAWYNEDKFYTYSNDTCKPKEMCGHYTQVTWATSKAVGCGMAFCPITTGGVTWKNAWLVTCNYGPAGNWGGVPFLSGTPCTQCTSGIGQCYNNLCRLCSTHSGSCECKQVCLNGGVLDAQKCSCSCADGFHGTDCSKECTDYHNNCGANPGWPKSWCDADHSYVLTNCPAMCDLCTRAPCLLPCSSKGGVLDSEKCVCNCKEGFQGADCSTCAKDCQNGGVLNQEECSCKCPPGFNGANCEKVCEDTHEYCGANPGWPKSWCDADHSYVLTNCPAMCDLCTRAPCLIPCNSKGGTLDMEKCVCNCNKGFEGADCGTCTKVCKNGGVLNNQDCVCKCTDGYTGDECGKVCEDTHVYCGANPGWPKSWCDADHSYVLTNCPAMCDLCTRAPCLLPCSLKGGILDSEKCVCNCNEGFQGADCSTCVKVCKNGGVLNQQECSCQCGPGFTGVDCGKVCEDTHEYCGANPGWPKSWCDADHSYVLTNCPAMCDLCVPASAREMLMAKNIMKKFQ